MIHSVRERNIEDCGHLCMTGVVQPTCLKRGKITCGLKYEGSIETRYFHESVAKRKEKKQLIVL